MLSFIKNYSQKAFLNYNAKRAKLYRESDDLIKNDPNYYLLKDFLLSYFEKIKNKKDVLEIGCGTGRYFHLWNGKEVNRFVGIDISPAMINIAKNNPPFKNEITLKNIELIQGDFLTLKDIGKFDFIYSIGVLGEHIPLRRKILEHIYQNFLKKNGIFIFTAVCWFARSLKRRLLHYCLNFLRLSDYSSGFFTNEKEIIDLKRDLFELLELKFWNERYPHYLVALKKN